jgi:cytochrome c biogenesis protein CcdA
MQDQPVVRFYLFYGETCPHCHEVMENYLPTVYEKYGDQVEYEYLEVWSNTDDYLTMLALETRLGVPEERQGAVPALVIGDKVLIGAAEIPAELEGYIDEYLAQGGVDFPSLENLPEVVLPTPEPAVQILVFLDTNHADFDALSSVMTTLVQQYGDSFVPYAIDITTSENADRLAQLNAAFGVTPPPSGTPEVLIDRQLLVGMEEIESQLPGLVEEYLAQGGSTVPSWEELLAGQPAITPTPTSENAATPSKPIYLAYFEQAGCQDCARTTYDLRVVKERYPQLVVESFSMEEEQNKALNEWLSDKYDVPEEKRLSTPMIFVGDDVLIGEEAYLSNLLSVVGKYAETGAERTWDDFDPEEGSQGIIDRFQSFGVLTVLGAGLIDGLNPCAFATLVFFISYLAFTGRRGRDILFVGISFTLGVFLTYLLVGVGLLKVVQSLNFFSSLGRWVYLLTALLCVALAALTFRDYFRARKGQAGEMALKLPLSIRRRINKVIRENAQMRAFVAVAFFTGFVVSLLELACTGQVYLPTIVYVMSQPDLAAQAFLYLVLYCLMFILPLVIVFALSFFGTSSEQLGQFINRHTSTIKLATGFLFVGLALWMTWTVAPLFGIHSPWNWILLAGVVVVIGIAVLVLFRTDKRPPQKAARRRRSRA